MQPGGACTVLCSSCLSAGSPSKARTSAQASIKEVWLAVAFVSLLAVLPSRRFVEACALHCTGCVAEAGGQYRFADAPQHELLLGRGPFRQMVSHYGDDIRGTDPDQLGSRLCRPPPLSPSPPGGASPSVRSLSFSLETNCKAPWRSLCEAAGSEARATASSKVSGLRGEG